MSLRPHRSGWAGQAAPPASLRQKRTVARKFRDRLLTQATRRLLINGVLRVRWCGGFALALAWIGLNRGGLGRFWLECFQFSIQGPRNARKHTPEPPLDGPLASRG